MDETRENWTVAALLYHSVECLEERLQNYYARLGAVPDDRVATFEIGYLEHMWRSQLEQDPARPTALQVAERLFRRGLLERLEVRRGEPPRYQMHALLVLLAQSLEGDEEVPGT
jgi:hypothetical protein